MYSFSENYRLRQYYLQEQHVPVQSVLKRYTTSNFAALLFKFINPKLKVLVGLEPPLKGGGRDWYVYPKEILGENRAVLKPLAHEILHKINHFGIEHLGFQIIIAHYKNLPKDMLQESNNVWKNRVEKFRLEQSNKNANLLPQNNTDNIKYVFDLFSAIYQTSLNNMRSIFHEGLINHFKISLEETVLRMKNRYSVLCKSQALLITYDATVKLKQEKARLKAKFIENLGTCRTETTKTLYDLNVDKHIAAEKLRTLLEHQKTSCQIYGYLKEKDECFKEIEKKNQQQKKYVKHLTKASDLLNFETSFVEQKERKIQERYSNWLQKARHVVKNFQLFISYCLNMLPDHADFFINMEKLLLLQFSEILENPIAESTIAVEEKQSNTPVPQPKPFYLFCDRGYKAQVALNLCPKHSDTSSASKVPVIVVNKRCLYTVCNNFEQFSNKPKEYIHGNRGDDTDIEDDLVYEDFVPVQYTTSQQLLETKLASSLLQILLHNKSNIKKVPVTAHDMPHCSNTSAEEVKKTMKPREKSKEQIMPMVQSQTNNTADTSANINRLEHAREPRLERYLKQIEPKVCGCGKSCKKQLVEHLPMYMRKTSKFDTLELGNYETCSEEALKKLVKRSRPERDPSPIVPIFKTKDISTQYSDEQFNFLCTCSSHNNIDSFEKVRTENHFSFGKVSPSFMKATQSSFAIDRAHSLRKLIKDTPELTEIFNVKEKG
ncbi:hypothetical protein PYW08_005806 [Mythimna loreyi]|uniref:Uncharacterized protein n=1 Tax=Mythimna loreyi TaxID=667449 RepID=A0ACC2QHL6_9NEOP|nr:hypothetical protein PYW08_005806 [Mythimna loreyi]